MRLRQRLNAIASWMCICWAGGATVGIAGGAPPFPTDDTPVFAEPPPLDESINDFCESATPISGTGLFTFDTRNATSDPQPWINCRNDDLVQFNRDVWFRWTSNCDGRVVISTGGLTSGNTIMQVLVGDCKFGTFPLACSDDDIGKDTTCLRQSALSFFASAGQEFFIRIGAPNDEPGTTGQFRIQCVGNSNGCQSASGSLCQFADEQAAFPSYSEGPRSMDNFTPGVNGKVTGICFRGLYLALQNPRVSTFDVRYWQDENQDGFPDTVIAEFRNLVSDRPRLTGTVIPYTGIESEYHVRHESVPLKAGKCYWVEIAGSSNTLGKYWVWSTGNGDGVALSGVQGNEFSEKFIIQEDFAFCFDTDITFFGSFLCPPPFVQPLTPCQKATFISSSTSPQNYFGTTFGTHSDPDFSPGCNNGINVRPGRWYAIVGNDRVYRLTLCNARTSYDSAIAVYTGNCNNLQCLDSAELSPGCGDDPTVTFRANRGTVYYVQVSGVSKCKPDDAPVVCGTPRGCYQLNVTSQPDCNGNGVADPADIQAGTSNDCNSNGRPDECENDCNCNGIDDSLDIANGTSRDCDRNGIPDECGCGCTDLVFALDTTGSVGTQLADLQSVMSQLTTNAQALSGGDLRYGLVTYEGNASTQGLLIAVNSSLTFDVAGVDSLIQGLFASGGGGLPEASDEALREILTNTVCSPITGNFSSPFRRNCQRLILLMTDDLPAGCDDNFELGVDDVNAHNRALDARRQLVKIGSIYAPPSGFPDPQAEIIMEDYATTSGGRYYLDLTGGTLVGESALDFVNSFVGRCPIRSCPCDFNGDGTVNAADQTAFTTAFAAGCADIDGDGDTDGNDFSAFFDCFMSPPSSCGP